MFGDQASQQLCLPVNQSQFLHETGYQSQFAANFNTTEQHEHRHSSSSLENSTTFPSPRNNSQELTQQLVARAEQMVNGQCSLLGLDQIQFQEQIGEGRYGQINLGVVKAGTPLHQLYQQHIVQNNIQKKSKKFRVAVKQLHGNVQADLRAVVGFQDEVDLLCRLKHPSIIRCFGVGTTEEFLKGNTRCHLSLASASAVCSKTFLVMEYAKGGTLSQLILKQMQQPAFKLFSFSQAIRWSRQIGEALEYLHEQNDLIIHRDISAANILLTSKNLKKADAKISDFGLYRVVHEGYRWLQAANSKDSSFMTDENLYKQKQSSPGANNNHDNRAVHSCLGGHTYHLSGKTGNPLYMAPEVWLNQPYNEKVDIFALGCIMFEIFTGQLRIFDNMTHDVSYNNLLAQANEMSAGIRPRFPETLSQDIRHLISQCWHQDQARRPSAVQVVAYLRNIESNLQEGKDRRGKASCVIQ
eukprot:TRINITY_DN5215_c0_g1_i1.p1 TRINITY_DN5215_c0_g1~~TRINITY_DN5215_c0_g1_i1.p1  ORF type:complete len:530 (+),score=46.34 TRINITY_DN5215_c0_g1_i1:185-1591(+)